MISQKNLDVNVCKLILEIYLEWSLWPVKTLSCFSLLVLFWASTEIIILRINVKTDIGHMIADKFSSLIYEEAFI